MPRRRSEYESCRPPGPLPTMTTGYAPGGNGRSSRPRRSSLNSALSSRRVAQLPRFRLQDPEGDARVLDEERLEALAGEDEAAQRPDRHDVGAWRLAQQDRD